MRFFNKNHHVVLHVDNDDITVSYHNWQIAYILIPAVQNFGLNSTLIVMLT